MEKVFTSSTSLEQNDQQDDDWLEDGSDSAELNRERKARENEFHWMGYRDGIIAGKEASAQEGFNAGFKKAVLGGYKWGFVRGVASALTGLPDSPRGKLAERIEKKDALWKLCETVRSISTDDALRMFHDGTLLEGAVVAHHRQQKDLSSAGATASGEEGPGQLGSYYGELKSLISELGDVELPTHER